MFFKSIVVKGYYFLIIQFVNIYLLFIIDFSLLLIKTLIIFTFDYLSHHLTNFLMMTFSFMYP